MSRVKRIHRSRGGGSSLSECSSFSCSALIDLSVTSRQSVYVVPFGQSRIATDETRAIILSVMLRDFSVTPSTANLSIGFNEAADNVETDIALAGTNLFYANMCALAIPESQVTANALRAIANAVLGHMGQQGQALSVKVTNPEPSPVLCTIEMSGYLF